MRRPQFKYEKEVKDPVTGEMVKVFSEPKRLVRQLLQVPFALVTAILLGTLIAGCFGIEIFISEVYDGPGKGLLVSCDCRDFYSVTDRTQVFLPTGLLTILVPVISTLLTDFATRLTEYENYETSDSYEAAMTQKIFLLNFITSYLGIILTAFVYEPFGRLIVPYLDIFNVTVKPFANDEKELKVAEDGFQINPDRLRKQVIYFAVTAQIVGLALEVIVPYVKRKGFRKFNQMKSKRAVEKGGAPDVAMNDSPEEATFLARVRNEAELDVYDVNTDLREMVMQVRYCNASSFSI
jgi:anoctamin-10